MRNATPVAGIFTERAGGACGSTGSGAIIYALKYDAGQNRTLEENKQHA